MSAARKFNLQPTLYAIGMEVAQGRYSMLDGPHPALSEMLSRQSANWEGDVCLLRLEDDGGMVAIYTWGADGWGRTADPLTELETDMLTRWTRDRRAGEDQDLSDPMDALAFEAGLVHAELKKLAGSENPKLRLFGQRVSNLIAAQSAQIDRLNLEIQSRKNDRGSCLDRVGPEVPF